MRGPPEAPDHAAGINDSLALGILHEALGRRNPVVVVPHVNAALASNPIYRPCWPGSVSTW